MFYHNNLLSFKADLQQFILQFGVDGEDDNESNLEIHDVEEHSQHLLQLFNREDEEDNAVAEEIIEPIQINNIELRRSTRERRSSLDAADWDLSTRTYNKNPNAKIKQHHIARKPEKEKKAYVNEFSLYHFGCAYASLSMVP